jgi:hypothetical protein
LPAAGWHANLPVMPYRPAAAGLLACLLAVVMHVLMPPGWMPAAGGLAPCSVLAAAGETADGPDDRPADDGCDFALAAAPLLAADGPDAAWLQRLPPTPEPAARLCALHVARAWPRPPGQGPPLA